jgi:hypothetical protein
MEAIPNIIEEITDFIINKYPNVGFTFEYGDKMFYGFFLNITFSGSAEPLVIITGALIMDLFDIVKTKENVLTELKAVVSYEIDTYLQKQLD